MPDLTLVLSEEEVNVILQVVQKHPLPFEFVFPLLSKIKGQIDEQLGPKEESSKTKKKGP